MNYVNDRVNDSRLLFPKIGRLVGRSMSNDERPEDAIARMRERELISATDDICVGNVRRGAVCVMVLGCHLAGASRCESATS